MKTIELVVEILPDERDKRQSLLAALDVALITSGIRIQSGTYKVTIERVKSAPVKSE